MTALVIVFTLLCFILLRLISGKFARIMLTLIVMYLDFSLIISTFNPYNMYEVSFFTYFLLMLSVFCIVIGALSYKKGNITSIYLDKCSKLSYDWLLSNKTFKFCFIISLILLVYLAVTQWKVVLFLGGAGPLKINFFELVFNRNSALYFVYKVIVSPLFFLSLVIASMMILKKDQRFKYSLFIGLFIVLFCFVGGKRGYYATSIVYIVLCLFVIQFISKSLKLKVFLKIGTIFSVFFLAAVLTTATYTGLDFDKDSISETSGDVKKQVITYSIGSFRLLDYAIKNRWFSDTPTLFGRATLGGGADYYGCAVLQRLGFDIKQASEIGMEKLQNNFISISADDEMNFAYTSLAYFMFDFGIFGVVFFSFLFGKFLHYGICLFYKYRTIGALLLMVYTLNGAQSFFQSWFNVAIYAQPLFLLAYMLHKKELKYRIKNNES